ncbi:MAG: sulfatase [Planctomycetota bacterium]
MNRPNILYLHVHDLGRYCQPYGHAIPTPNVQRLAEEDVLFRQAFCAAPTCSSSRGALLTGQYPHSCGLPGLVNRGFDLEHPERHIVRTLRTAGYRSALIGTQHIRKDASTIGYDEIVDVRKKGAHNAAAEWFAGAPQQPFFASVGFGDTHRVYAELGPQEDERYCLPPLPLPDKAATRRDIAAFKASARILDEKYGVVLDALELAGLADNTLVICTTDHGIAFPKMKCNLNQHGCGVAFIMRGPGGFTGGKVRDALISQVDVYPTLCDLLDIGPPEWLQGRSFMPVVRGETDEVNEHIFTENTWHACYEPMRSVRTKRYSYVRRFDDRTRPILPNCDDGPSKDVWLENGWRDEPITKEQLYDLIFDPTEVNNLVDDPRLADVLDDLRDRLDRFMHETDDPLLRGPVPMAPGGQYNDIDGLSPNEPLIQA